MFLSGHLRTRDKGLFNILDLLIDSNGYDQQKQRIK